MHLDRRLAAILSADVKGYSRLMSGDDVATVRTLTRNWFGPYLEALALAALEREAEARAALRRALELDPALDLERARRLLVHRSSEKVEMELGVLRRLGLP